jgi:uncharacterized protein YbjT (DUF2867 family)
MTNTFQWLETIKRDGTVYNGMGAGKTAPVAPHDIAAVVVHALTDPNSEEIYEVTGGELLTLSNRPVFSRALRASPSASWKSVQSRQKKVF